MYCVGGSFSGSIKQSVDKLYDSVKEYQCYQLSPSVFPFTLRGPGDSEIGLTLILEYSDPGKFHTRTTYFEGNRSGTQYLVHFYTDGQAQKQNI